MKRTVILSLALIVSTSSITAQPFSKERILATTCIAATGSLVFCMYKAIRGSKTARTILKGVATAAFAAGAVASAVLCTDSHAVQDDIIPQCLLGAAILGIGACASGNAIASDLIDLNKSK